MMTKGKQAINRPFLQQNHLQDQIVLFNQEK